MLIAVFTVLLAGNVFVACLTGPVSFMFMSDEESKLRNGAGRSVTTKELARDTLWQNRDTDAAGACITEPPSPAAVDWRTFCLSK